MKKTEKIAQVNQLTDTLKTAKSAVFVNFVGLTVKDQQDLKRKLKESSAKMIVVKNTLIKRAAEAAGYPQESITDSVLTGQTGIVYSTDDAVSPIQVLGKYASEHEKPQFKVGIVDGKFADKDGLIKISKLPAKEVLYAQVIGGMSAPMYGIVGTLQANMQKLLWILQSKASQN